MANEITEVPDSVSSAGYTFNYALWTAGTSVTLLNAPWDSDYLNVAKPGFNYSAWIADQPGKTTISQMKHARLNQPVRISTPFEVAAQYNYLRATNPAQPVAGSLPSTYYYFIKDVEYSAPNTTTLVLQLDVWATFINKVSFERAFVDRSHAGIANENQMTDNGRNYLTVPEGMDLGGEMVVDAVYEDIYGTARGFGGVGNTDFSIMVTSSVSLKASRASADEPKIVTASGTSMENLPNGSDIYLFTEPDALEAFLFANQDASWITQGITAIQAIPKISNFNIPNLNPVDVVGMEGDPRILQATYETIHNQIVDATTDWTADLSLPSRYAGLNKFKTYPYTVIEMTSYTGQPLVLKPESLPNRKLSYAVILHLNPASARLTFVPYNYNAASGAGDYRDDYGVRMDKGDWLDFATSISNFPQFSTVNNSYAGYMASNKNQIAFSHRSAMWDQNRAMMGAQTAVANANAGINMVDQQAQNQNQFNNQMMRTNLNHRAAQGVIDNTSAMWAGGQQVLGGNPLGGAISAVGGMTTSTASSMNDMVQINQQTAHQNQLLQANTHAALDQQSAVRDNNYKLAGQAAQGDYANQIAGIDAKVQDMQMLQPTTSGQIGGESFNLAKLGWGVWFKVKRMQGAPMRQVGEHWLRYGYAVHSWMNLPNSLMVMDKFTYWKTLETVVLSNGCPEMYRMTIRGILEKGVTVWNNPDDIGRIDPATNNPIGGFSY